MPMFPYLKDGGPLWTFGFPGVDSAVLWREEMDVLCRIMEKINACYQSHPDAVAANKERKVDGKHWLSLVVDAGRRWSGDYIAPDIADSYESVRIAIQSARGPLVAECGLNPNRGHQVAGLLNQNPAALTMSPWSLDLMVLRKNSFGLEDADLSGWLAAVHGFIIVWSAVVLW